MPDGEPLPADLDRAFVNIVRRIAGARRIDDRARLLRAWPLTGGVSAQMVALEVTLPDGDRRRWVVRRHGPVDLAQNPHIAAHEPRLLRILRAAGLPVPEPIYVDASGEIFATPYLVLAYVDGDPAFELSEVPDLICRLGGLLATIHSVDPARHDLTFLPRQGAGPGPPSATLDEGLSEGRIRGALEVFGAPSSPNAPALLHGDFWPGNVIWHEGRLAAVIDWEDARVGDPLADLGNSRLEVLWAFGPDAMHRFTGAYLAHVPHLDLTDLPYWDLCAALRPVGKLAAWGLPLDREALMRERHRAFVTRAIEALAP